MCVSLACVFIFWNTFKVYILNLQPSPPSPVIYASLMISQRHHEEQGLSIAQTRDLGHGDILCGR